MYYSGKVYTFRVLPTCSYNAPHVKDITSYMVCTLRRHTHITRNLFDVYAKYVL